MRVATMKFHLSTILLVIVTASTAKGQGSDCPMLQITDLGSTTSLTSSGWLAAALSFHAAETLTYQILEYNTVCLGQGSVRDTYRSASFIVRYLDSSGAENTVQLYLQCISGSWTTQTLGSHQNAISTAGGDFDTALRTDCYLCSPPFIDARISVAEGCFGIVNLGLITIRFT